MPYEEKNQTIPHSLHLEGRERLTVTAVEEILRFDGETLLLKTAGGELTVRGSGLRVDKLDKGGGELRAAGRVDELSWSMPRDRKSLWAQLWG